MAKQETAKEKRHEKGSLPTHGEVFVSAIEYNGVLHLLTNKHVYTLTGRYKDRLMKLEFTII
jgi:hypothetical protein